MSELVTDAMVEAATVASINVSLAPWGSAITTTDHLQGGVEALAEMRAALKAAAPFIAAKALRDAADEVCTHSYKSDEVTGVPTSEQVSWLVGTSDAHRMFDRLLKDRAKRFERGES